MNSKDQNANAARPLDSLYDKEFLTGSPQKQEFDKLEQKHNMYNEEV